MNRQTTRAPHDQRSATLALTPIGVAIAALMAATSATLAVASALHFGVVLHLGAATIDDPFPGAAIPEAVITGVLACGVVAIVMRAHAAWALAIGSTLFAIVGFLVGLTFTVPDLPMRMGDLIYHLCGLLMLLAALELLLLPTGRAPLRPTRGLFSIRR